MSGSAGITGQRIILHADMDCFYAAVEMHDRPETAGKPVIVGADPAGGAGRGVVSTCSYEARAFGVKSAMPIGQAYRLCPDAVYLRPDMAKYAAVSAEIMGIFKSTGCRVQQVSIDEAFLDAGHAGSFPAARDLAVRLKQEIRERVGITCSFGVAPSKIVAKIASDYKKPDGLTVVTPEEVPAFLAPLSVRKIPGVGGKTGAQLEALEITTIGELATCDIQRLIGAFGRSAGLLREAALGQDESEVVERDEVKSISKETTFARDTDDPAEIAATMELLVTEVARSLAEEGLYFKTVTVRVRYTGFVSKTKAKSLLHNRNDEAAIRSSAGELLRELWDGKPIRRLGLRLSGLWKQDAGQQTLF
ncbi:DNA polymerase IV [Methanoregula sp. UBA64]|jgi:DNA polymerase IV (archaeal DinB-like DNA polymerase)|uniref:DNA polymerase IV n=1 Tax=Methanoregula sp. UBA64 TaxID=1915554 RepID=UPI0025FE248C|nr:DNA polymerase IV [Methanoregula sp. UBA64]